jgi:hypothetical protein
MVEHGHVDNNVPHQRPAEHHGSVESLPRKEKRYGAANLDNSEEITKPLPETNLSKEIDHFGDSKQLGSSCEKKQTTMIKPLLDEAEITVSSPFLVILDHVYQTM